GTMGCGFQGTNSQATARRMTTTMPTINALMSQVSGVRGSGLGFGVQAAGAGFRAARAWAAVISSAWRRLVPQWQGAMRVGTRRLQLGQVQVTDDMGLPS